MAHNVTIGVLAELPPHRIALFRARIERWQSDLLAALALLYDDPEHVAEELLAVAAIAYAARDEDLQALDLQRTLRPDWFQEPGMLGYAAYADRFAGTLRGVGQHAGYLRDLGVTYLHLMPLLTPRPAPNDGGYAVQNFRSVREDLGTVEDLSALTATLRDNGISLCLDLVLNHVAREHDWAVRARAGDERMRRYFHVFPDRVTPDAYERTLPEVFPDFAPGNFTWDADLNGWVWTTFNNYQWDVNWANPEVLQEYASIILDLANHGVEIFRLDAIAFTWKRLGTNCQNQPEVHALTQALRTLTRIACPAVIFKAEAIVGPQDLLAYLGQGRHHGKISDLAYHNSLMVQIWSMLASQEVWLAAHALRQLPAPPSSTAWVTYVRCHDDIGWAISDEDATAVGRSGFEHRRFLSDFYSGEFPGSWARGMVFQENRATGDRRISGSLASLAGLEAGDAHAVRRILLAHAIILGFGGIPVIWMGDEVPLLNDYGFAEEPPHANDNRWVHRPRMPWEQLELERSEVHAGLRHLVNVRKQLPHLHASVPTEVLEPRDSGILLTLRRHPLGPLLGVYNVTAEPRSIPREVLSSVGLGDDAIDHLAGSAPRFEHAGIEVPAYTAAWISKSL